MHLLLYHIAPALILYSALTQVKAILYHPTSLSKARQANTNECGLAAIELSGIVPIEELKTV